LGHPVMRCTKYSPGMPILVMSTFMRALKSGMRRSASACQEGLYLRLIDLCITQL